MTNQSDIYALGATIYHILTGRVPVGSYEQSDAPQCVRQAMAANPADRFESVKDFCRAFMHVTGTAADRGPGGDTTPEDRRLMFDNISGVDQYLITFKDSDHTVLTGRPGRRDQGAGLLAIHDLVCISSTAFWDAYLKADVKARAWLTDGGLEDKLGDLATVEMKIGEVMSQRF